MELESKQKGNLTELQCITACYELGYSVSIPYGENSRYDFILDLDSYRQNIELQKQEYTNNGYTCMIIE